MSLSSTQDSVTALIQLRDTLRDNLTDPYVTAGGNSRSWIFTDKPLAGATFPRIQIEKVDNPSEPITIGSNYAEYEQVFANIWVYVKNPFKVTVGGVEYKNEQLVEYVMGQIKQTLKAQFNTLFDVDVKGYKHVNTTSVEYDADTQLHFGAVLVRVFYFNR